MTSDPQTVAPDLFTTADGTPLAGPGQVVGLFAGQCTDCSRFTFPARGRCPSCSAALTRVAFDPHGVVVLHSAVLHDAPGALVLAPYQAGFARFDQDLLVSGLIVTDEDTDEVSIGDRIRCESYALTDGRLTYAFRVVRNEQETNA